VILVENKYYEKHHILPRSLGGKNNKSNIVSLTAKEHFVSHRLLFKFCKGKDKSKMGFALHSMMYINNPSQNERMKITSRKYSILREIYKFIKGENHPCFGKPMWNDFQKEMISLRMTGKNNHQFGKSSWNKGLTKELDSRIKKSSEKQKETNKTIIHPFYQKKRPVEHCLAISKGSKGKSKSESHKNNLSKSLKGISPSRIAIENSAKLRKGTKQEKIICPYCLKEGGHAAMYRWHFENCKENKIL
jgi:hypothetical protein